MAEFKYKPEQTVPVIKQYKEQDRHDDMHTAQRLPVGQRRDFQPRIKRKPQDGSL